IFCAFRISPPSSLQIGWNVVFTSCSIFSRLEISIKRPVGQPSILSLLRVNQLGNCQSQDFPRLSVKIVKGACGGSVLFSQVLFVCPVLLGILKSRTLPYLSVCTPPQTRKCMYL
uniref:Uncharacterized protein n=1 Tax=Mus spicilegus TaxID=10103 RepID=A0A8C6HSD5_MUSSI